MDRLVRSRAWVVIIGVGLIGIVAMQVSMLKLNSGIGRAVDTAATLERSNASLKAEISRAELGRPHPVARRPARLRHARARRRDATCAPATSAPTASAPPAGCAAPTRRSPARPAPCSPSRAGSWRPRRPASTADAGVARSRRGDDRHAATAATTAATAADPAAAAAPTQPTAATHRRGPAPATTPRRRPRRAATAATGAAVTRRADRPADHRRRRGDDPIVGLTERRIGLLFAIFLALLLIAASRAAWLGAVKGDVAAGGRQPRSRSRCSRCPAGRGAITDRNGIELAVSEPADDIAVTPYLIKKPMPSPGASRRCSTRPRASCWRSSRQKGGFVYLARNLPGTESAKIKKLHIAGLQFIPSSRREYPRKWMASQVLGWVGTDGDGLAGLEYAKDALLRGSDGERRIVKDALGEPIVLQETKRAERGKDLRLTLDAELQGKVENVLAEVGLTWRPKGATALVMDPYSNTILALANWPRVDANDSGGAPDYAAQNRAVGFNYEPGSTFKPFTVAGALEEKVVTPTDIFHLPPTIDVADRTIKEAHERGTVDLYDDADPRAVQQRRHGAHRPAPRRDALRSLGAALRLRPQDRHRAARRGSRPGAQARRSTPARRWATCRSARASRSRRCSSRPRTRRSPTAGSCAGRGSSPRSTASAPRCRAAGA